MRILGLDPGLRRTGYGIIDAQGGRLAHVGSGRIESPDQADLAGRLLALYDGLVALLARYAPDEAAVEETFVNTNAQATLKLGQARAIALLVPAQAGLPVAEYAANLVKKSVVGVGHAEKRQVQDMIRRLLPGSLPDGPDAADALAIAITHAGHRRIMSSGAFAAPPGRARLP